jgi:hypothetical protein
LFVFDENYRTLQAQGSTINLAPWYIQAEISIIHAAFVCGNEEIVLVDSSAQARIFSFVTLQFRWDFFSPLLSPRSLFTHASEDPPPYNFRRFPAQYSPHQMDPAFWFTLKARRRFSLRIIGKHLDLLRESI